ncbi:hypothetical protein RRG08_043711 [Elysia crispata]|uniref:Fibronectin type-III domain-containing protein n=1 Tax=Elysia crispata TaxID=231223 RepID=A0AAE0ZPA3_9GAST|nr:hypothetical protein RRG08_043711 [Elysia crispata]
MDSKVPTHCVLITAQFMVLFGQQMYASKACNKRPNVCSIYFVLPVSSLTPRQECPEGWVEYKAASHPEDLTGEKVGYTVYFRRKKKFSGQWTAEVKGRENAYAALVGADNFYLEYEVMVGAFNPNGSGPNSTVHIVMSAEDVPIGAPTDVTSESYNATAMIVFWTPVPNTREFIRGNVLGYQNQQQRNMNSRDPKVSVVSSRLD